MEQRRIQRLARSVSVVGLGTWQLGADWGTVTPQAAHDVLDAAVDAGVTFFDTADVYGDGRSEQFCGGLHARHPEILVATVQLYEVERIDLVQLHCPPDEVYEDDATFEALDELVDEGHIRAYGVSVETCAQALRAIARPRVASVQIILNCFRLKPLEQVLPAAHEAGVGIIARVPLASGLLSGRYDEQTTFAPEDHRSYNRHGEAFDVGETFAGVPYETGVAAARELGQLLDPGTTLAQFALRWVLDQPGVNTVIPGARNVEQVRQNVAAASLAPLRPDQLEGVAQAYDRLIREHVHGRW
jgi:aryl-alcohol dehydrogenase-like predicted oxidoreductase